MSDEEIEDDQTFIKKFKKQIDLEELGEKAIDFIDFVWSQIIECAKYVEDILIKIMSPEGTAEIEFNAKKERLWATYQFYKKVIPALYEFFSIQKNDPIFQEFYSKASITFPSNQELDSGKFLLNLSEE